MLAAALALSGCSIGGEEAIDQGGPAAPPAQYAGDSDQATPETVAGASATVPAGDLLGEVNREVITNGTVTITADDPIAAGEKAAKLIEAAGGRADGRTEYAPTDGDKGGATLILRIPSRGLSGTLAAIKELGSVESVQISTSDVTTEAQDMDARITALDASVVRLLALLSKASDTSTLVELETAISDRQGELDGLKSQRRYLSDQVAMSTISLTLSSEATAPKEEPETFWGALLAGLASFGAFFTGLLLALGYGLPWLVLSALILLVAALALKRRRRNVGTVTPATASAESTESSQ